MEEQLGTADHLSDRGTRPQRSILLFGGAALLANNFDLTIYSLAMPQIQMALRIPEETVGFYSGLIRMGVTLAFPLVVLADMVGRRKIMLLSLIGMTVATVLTAFAQNDIQFLCLQTVSRCFAYALEMLCFVMVAEEFSAARRGWALGRLTAMGALGAGLAGLLFGFVNALPNTWRDLYIVGAVGLVVFALALPRVQETSRFAAYLSDRSARQIRDHGFIQPLMALVRIYPVRLLALAATAAPISFGLTPALAFFSKHLQEDHGLSPGYVSVVLFIGGGASVLGYLYAGQLSDRIGRRRLLSVGMCAAPIFATAFYLLPGDLLILPSWMALLLVHFLCEISLSALGCELFPTSYRATATGTRHFVSVVAALAGLATEGALFPLFGSHVPAILCVVAVVPVGLAPLLRCLPETSSRELE